MASISLPCPSRCPARASGSRYGAKLMFSMPPAMTTSASPALIACAASITDFNPDPHTLLMVTAATEGATPPKIIACRAGACPTPACSTLPRITSSTVSASNLVRAMVSLMSPAAKRGAGTVDSPPMKRPMGVRSADTMTARSILNVLLDESRYCIPRTLRAMIMRWISLVPSPISPSLASR